MMFGGSPEHMGRMIDRMLDGLNATDAQRTQIKQIAAAAAADLKAQAQPGRGAAPARHADLHRADRRCRRRRAAAPADARSSTTR